MREYKFRGRDEHGVWHYGYLANIRLQSVPRWDSPTVIRFAGIFDEDDLTNRVDLDTVGQFTGLLDSNGKEIYEGDIVRCKRDDWADDDAEVYAVEYFADLGYPAFELDGWTDGESNGLSYFSVEGTLEVIGNVHDNPDLLEATHD